MPGHTHEDKAKERMNPAAHVSLVHHRRRCSYACFIFYMVLCFNRAFCLCHGDVNLIMCMPIVGHMNMGGFLFLDKEKTVSYCYSLPPSGFRHFHLRFHFLFSCNMPPPLFPRWSRDELSDTLLNGALTPSGSSSSCSPRGI